MSRDLSECKRKYDSSRHHAWAGLGFLSIMLAIRIIFPDALAAILQPILVVLIVYIMIALIFTYKYRTGLYAKKETLQVPPSIELEKEKLKTDLEKERLKTEKKKAKAGAKVKKKVNK